MYLSGTLFASEAITCSRFIQLPIAHENELSLTQNFFALSYSGRVVLYDEKFEEHQRFNFDETIVQFEFLKLKQNNHVQICLITYNNRIYISDLLIDDGMQSETQTFYRLGEPQCFDFSEEIRGSHKDIRILNYAYYLVVDFESFFLVLGERSSCFFKKQQDQHILQITEKLVADNTKRPEVLLKNGQSNRFTIKYQESNELDYVFMILTCTLERSDIELLGAKKHIKQIMKDNPLREVVVGQGIEEAFLISKDIPLYIMRSRLEDFLRIVDVDQGNLIKQIYLRLDILNVFPFEKGCQGLMSLRDHDKPIKYIFSLSDYSFSTQTLNQSVIMTGALGYEDTILITSQFENSYVIKDNQYKHTFQNIGPIQNLQDVRNHQRNIYITTSLRKNQTYLYRKGIKINHSICKYKIALESQNPSKIFFPREDLIVISFFDSTRAFNLIGGQLVPNNKDIVQSSITLEFKMIGGETFLQITEDQIVFLNQNLERIQSTDIGSEVLYAFGNANKIIVFDYMGNHYTYLTRNLQYLGAKRLLLNERFSCVQYSEANDCFVGSIVGDPSQLFVLDKFQSIKQFQENEYDAVTDILTVDQWFYITLKNGVILKFQFVEGSLNLTLKVGIQYSFPLSMVSFRNSILVLSNQLQYLDNNDLVDINWDLLLNIQSCGELLVGVNKAGELEIVQLDVKQSQQCSQLSLPIQAQQEVLYLFQHHNQFIVITQTDIIVYDQVTLREIFYQQHNVKIYRSKFMNKVVYIYGEESLTTKGIIVQYRFNGGAMQTSSIRTKSSIKGFKMHKGNFWLHTKQKLKCYQQLEENEKSILSKNYQIDFVGFDVGNQYILIYDEFKGVWLFKYDLKQKVQVGWAQYHHPVWTAAFIQEPKIICMEKRGYIRIASVNSQSLGIFDRMIISVQSQILVEPVTYLESIQKNAEHNLFIYGTILGKIGYLCFLPNQKNKENFQGIVQDLNQNKIFLHKSSINQFFVDMDSFENTKQKRTQNKLQEIIESILS